MSWTIKTKEMPLMTVSNSMVFQKHWSFAGKVNLIYTAAYSTLYTQLCSTHTLPSLHPKTCQSKWNEVPIG